MAEQTALSVHSDDPQQSGLPGRVGVIGGGRMGAGIAHAFLIKGCAVAVIETSNTAAEAALQRVTASVHSSVQRGKLTDDTVLQNLSVSSDFEELAGAELVIEAVPEDFEMKRQAFASALAVVPEAVLASNTSSLSITELAATTPHPENVIGLHFFNPVPASTLVEVVLAQQSSTELVATARGWVAALGKRAVVVSDAPGFASSRLGVALALEAIRMVESGVASAEDIDAAMELGYKHPTGPLRTTDVVGLDVRLNIAEYLASELGERFEPPQLLRAMVARGELGQKSGKGFYDWS